MDATHGLSLGELVFKGGRRIVLPGIVLALVGCGSSSDSGSSPPPPPPPPVNQAPTTNAGPDQTVQELSVVSLAGTATDPEMDPLTYSWLQTAGATVTLTNASNATASFTAPDVAAATPEMFSFELTATDPAGLSSTDQINVTVQEAPVALTMSGILSYEFPPPNAGCNGLNFNGIEVRPIRQATVQLLDASGTNVLDSVISSDTGAYSFTVNGGTDFIVRVRAELKNANWDVEVRNNVDPAASVPLNQRPLYVLDFPFNSGAADNPNLDLTATTGWGGTSFTGTRAAAPFSVLDAIYSGMLLVIAEDAAANFPPLDAYWSPDNTSTTPNGRNNDTGEIGTSFYTNDQLFLLGLDGEDIEEFDDHVVVHEWGHYFEDNFSRSDSIGGQHGIGDQLDMRVAFGEGWATALAGIALNDPQYCDTLWFNGNLTGFGIDLEDGNPGFRGWFNELSVTQIIYDLWDVADDGVDNSSIGFGPIYGVMTGAQAVTPAFTSIFTFATNLKLAGTGQDVFIDSLLTDHGVNPAAIDIYGGSEVNQGMGAPNDDVLPVYTDLTLGVTETICVNSQFDGTRTGNKLSEHRYLRLNLPATASVTFSMVTQNPPTTPSAGFDCTADPNDPENNEHSDPDFLGWRNGQLFVLAGSCEPNSEVNTTVLAAGDYVIDVNEFRHADDNTVDPNFPERVCFDFTAN